MQQRWVVFNTLFWVVVGLAEIFFHFVEMSWVGDKTHISTILGILYVILTGCILLIIVKVEDILEQYEWVDRILWAKSYFTSIGLVGTFIGMMILLYDISHTNVTDVAATFQALSGGMSTILWTGLSGMALSIILGVQMKWIFDKDEQ